MTNIKLSMIGIMTPKEYCTAFCDGYFCAQLGEKLTNGKVTDKELDFAKETAQKYMEQRIAYSAFDEKQKQEMRDNFKEWAETVMQGFKKRLRDSGRLIENSENK